MSLLDNYSEPLSDIKMYLQNDLRELEITAAQIYGSITYGDGKGFIDGVSDIDICVYTEKFNQLSPETIVNIINSSNKDFKDKQPIILRDHIANRIEFYINHPTIPFDITILAPELPNGKNLESAASYDSLEIIVGALYMHGVPLFGEIPEKTMVEEKFYPFYSDELRQKRLNILTNRVLKYTDRIEILQNKRDPNLIDHLYKTRNHFLKWLFIYLKKYPVALNKHLNFQLSDILNLSKEENDALMFLGKGDLFQLSSNYLATSRKYLNIYKKNVKFRTKKS